MGLLQFPHLGSWKHTSYIPGIQHLTVVFDLGCVICNGEWCPIIKWYHLQTYTSALPSRGYPLPYQVSSLVGGMVHERTTVAHVHASSTLL